MHHAPSHRPLSKRSGAVQITLTPIPDPRWPAPPHLLSAPFFSTLSFQSCSFCAHVMYLKEEVTIRQTTNVLRHPPSRHDKNPPERGVCGHRHAGHNANEEKMLGAGGWNACPNFV